MRIPEKGEMVLWYEHGDSSAKPATAMVIDVAGQDIAVAVFSKYLNHQVTKEAVRHISLMPTLTLPRRAQSGAWDYCPRTAELEATIHNLSNRLEDLEAKLAGTTAQPEASEEVEAAEPTKGGWTPERRERMAQLARERHAKNKQTETVA
jgi:hypothetical protein